MLGSLQFSLKLGYSWLGLSAQLRASDISCGRGAMTFAGNLIIPNTCWYNIFETYLGYWSCLIPVNFITTMSEQRSKTTSRKLCCEKLGTSHYIKSFMPLAHFSCSLLLK